MPARADQSRNVIELRGLSAGFDRHVVFENVDLDVRRREILGIVGGSGSGKSVMLRLMIGLMRPWAGKVRVLDQDLADLTPSSLHRLQRCWGVLFQDAALFSSLTVRENIERVIDEHVRLERPLPEQLSRLKIAMVGLEPSASAYYPFELSGGMRKKAGLARALALDPDILFLDEPTAGLDPPAAAAFDQLLPRLRRTLGLTVVLVTHDLDTLCTICDRVAVIAENTLLTVGPLDQVLAEPHPWIREFFHGPRGRAAAAH